MQHLERLWTSLVGDLGWVDLGALTIVALFFLLGLIRGLVWQIGRIVALLGSYVLSASYASPLAAYVFADSPASTVHVYVAYVVVFLAALFVLSWLARMAHAIVRRSGLSAFDRLGGGLLGIGTGGAVVFGLLTVTLMFGERLPLYHPVQASHAIDLGRVTVHVLGPWTPAPVRAAFDRPPYERRATRPYTAATPTLDRLLEDVARER